MIKNHRTIPALNSSSQTHNYHVKKSGEMKKRKKIDCRSKGEKILNCKRESRRINDKFPPALIESLIDYQQKRRTENQQRMKKKKAIKISKDENLQLLVARFFAVREIISFWFSSLSRLRSFHTRRRSSMTSSPSALNTQQQWPFFRLRFQTLFVDRSLVCGCASFSRSAYESSVKFSFSNGADVLREFSVIFLFAVAVGVFFVFNSTRFTTVNSQSHSILLHFECFQLPELVFFFLLCCFCWSSGGLCIFFSLSCALAMSCAYLVVLMCAIHRVSEWMLREKSSNIKIKYQKTFPMLLDVVKQKLYNRKLKFFVPYTISRCCWLTIEEIRNFTWT